MEPLAIVAGSDGFAKNPARRKPAWILVFDKFAGFAGFKKFCAKSPWKRNSAPKPVETVKPGKTWENQRVTVAGFVRQPGNPANRWVRATAARPGTTTYGPSTINPRCRAGGAMEGRMDEWT
jgi:hypothetical protein